MAKPAIKDMGINAEVVKVNDINQLVEAGILATPGFAVEGKIKSMGRVPSPDDIKKWIKAKMYGDHMKEECCCGMNMSDLARGAPYKDLGFRKVICARCGKEFYTDIKDKVCCFDCERIKPAS